MKKSRSSQRKTVRAGALLILSMCFAASALLRAGDVVAALPTGADDSSTISHQDTTASAAIADPDGRANKEDSPAMLVTELKRRRGELDERENRIEMRERTLGLLEKRLNDRLLEIQEVRQNLEKTANIVDGAAGRDVQLLANMYQQMKPKQAGLIFNEMAPSFAAGFMSEMRPDAAALILANMEAEKAYAVSLLMAGRNVGNEN